MSDTQKPVEETSVVAPASTEPPAVEPAPEVSAVDTAEADTAPVTETTEAPAEQPKEEPPKEESKEITPASDGILGYKAPGLVKSFRFLKRYFYFSDEAVEIKQLSAVAHPHAAWASQTGRGLLFFTKRAEDKATPVGIFNLSDISDLCKEGSYEFIFKVNGQRHAFQASSSIERDSWLVALEAKSTEAKAEKDTIISSEGYKTELEKLTKPPVVAAESSPKKSVDKAKEAVKKDESGPAADDKSRSLSRKRASIFGTIRGKKDVEEKKEETPAEPVVEAPATTEPPAEASTAAEGSEGKEEEKKSEAPAPKTKRASIFGSIFGKVTSQNHEKPEKEAAKETSVSSTAPQLENPVDESASKPIEPESVTAPAESEATAPTEPASSSKGLLSLIKDMTKTDEKKSEEKDDKKDEAPATTEPKEKRRPSIFGSLGSKKEKKAEVPEGDAAEVEAKPKKLSIFRRPSRVKASEGKKDKEAVATAETVPEDDNKPEPISKDAPVEEKPTENAEVAGKAKEPEVPVEPVNVASSSVPVQAAA